VLSLQDLANNLRIGHGYDLHRLELRPPAGQGRPLVLGGVPLDHFAGPIAHSDGDALLHAVTDAVLAAAGLPDIGQLFPDTDPRHHSQNSADFAREAAAKARAAGFEIVNVDSTIVAQAPKMASHIPAMREAIAAALGLGVAAVNVKAKTAEKMGPVGEGRAIEARAVCLLIGPQVD
jgi:2-C-methyl-D-erythritol 2,4-cyclodiphosphate synthase